GWFVSCLPSSGATHCYLEGGCYFIRSNAEQSTDHFKFCTIHVKIPYCLIIQSWQAHRVMVQPDSGLFITSGLVSISGLIWIFSSGPPDDEERGGGRGAQPCTNEGTTPGHVGAPNEWDRHLDQRR